MVVARGGKQQRLRFRPEQLAHARQHQMADDLGPRRSAGLAGDDGAQLRRIETIGQQLDLRGLSGALAAFERNELSASGRPAHRCFGHGQSFSALARNMPMTSSLAPSIARRMVEPVADRLRGIDRRFHGDIGAAPDPDHADRLALGDRRPHRAVIDDARDQLFAAVLRHHHLDRLAACELDRAALAAEHLGVADLLVGREQRARLEIAKTPFQHLLGFRGAIVGIFEAVDHDDQPGVVLHGRADHAVAAVLGVAGLQPVGAVERVQQRIAVLLADLVPGEFLLRRTACTCRDRSG